jgi:CheY-like chemotaxis protein
VLSLPVLHETAPAPVPLLRTQAMAAAGQQPPAIEPPALAAPAASAASRASAAPAKPQPDTEAASTHIIDDDRDHLAGADRIVLVVEDEPRYAAILYEIAQEMQYKCVVCGNGAEALLLAAQLRPHAILLDLGLPDRSGLLVLQELKSDPATRHIPVHVVSATDRTETALQLGAVGYAVKPSSHEELTGIFRQLEEKSRREVKRVLLVEDDARQRDAIVSLISDAGVEIVAVERGDEAIARLGGEIFDCMIVDLKLPDMQGGELLERMARTEGCSFPPVIVYTGRSLTRDEERELLRYSQTIIIKGARSPERLLDEVTLFLHQVESTLSQDQQRMLQAVRARDRMLDDRRVLLVDDDARNVFSLTSALEMQGMRVEIGRNGFDALELLETTPDIDVVLMDVMMPGMDGLEAMRRIRANPKYRNLPVIAITAKAMQNDQRECLDAGFSDYIAKPVNIDKLYSLLRVWVPTGKF